MALSHAKVADRFVQGDSANGTNLHSRFSDMANFTITRLNDQIDEFHYISTAVSYSTDVAHRVFNKFTDKHELWITTKRYSQSTDRHLQHLRWAYGQWCDQHGFDPHTVFASPHLNDRTNCNALDTVATLDASFWDVDRPRIRDASRQGVLVSRLHKINHYETILTKDRDPVIIAKRYSTVLTRARDTKTLLQNWLQLPVDEMRATVRAYLTLNDIARPASIK
jgi:frataxin-like iron-binding protein CyaY